MSAGRIVVDMAAAAFTESALHAVYGIDIDTPTALHGSVPEAEFA